MSGNLQRIEAHSSETVPLHVQTSAAKSAMLSKSTTLVGIGDWKGMHRFTSFVALDAT
jgi:hypothetical protein